MRVCEDRSPTTCAIMSQDKGFNGTTVESVKLEPSPDSNDSFSSSYGGRLKFFKDGKFILELSHRKEGEKNSWTSVPKKTYWPPSVTSAATTTTTTATTNNPRQESTTSLSVSDDNSSVQSSPWQRDHCWKQNSPRRAAVRAEMTFTMIPLPRAFQVRKIHCKIIKKRKRRPFELLEVRDVSCVNGIVKPVRNKSAIKSGDLNNLIQRLWDNVKISETSVQKTSSIFSPRKRILRELEKVTLTANIPEEQSQYIKRQRSKTSATNGTPRPSSTKGVSSYSIVSLLGNKEDQEQEPSFLRNLLRSPKRESSPEPSPKTRKNSPFSPSPEIGRPGGYGAPSASHSSPYSTHFMHSPPINYPPFYSSPTSVGNPPYFSPVSSPYRGPPHSMFIPYPMSSLPRSGTYPGLLPSTPYPFPYPWTPPAHSSVDIKKEEDTADVPLNLSKHPG